MFKLRKTAWSIALLLTSTASGAPTNYTVGMNPGMMLRVDQSSVQGMKVAMQQFLPHYINYDFELPDDMVFDVGFGDILWGLFSWHVEMTNIKYDTALWDFMDVKMDMERKMDTPLLKVDFPAVKKWEINADQTIDSWWADIFNGPIRLVIQDFDIQFNADLTLDKNGYINPIIYGMELHFGESFLHHENWFTALMLWQAVEFTMVMIRNSVYFLGQYIFTDMIGPVMEKFLNHYHFDFYIWSPFKGQNKYSIMSLDYRQTRAPYIGDGFLEFYYLGQTAYKHHTRSTCDLNKVKPMTFLSHKTYSQWVISDASATCMANEFAKSEIGKIQLNGAKLSKMFQGFTKKKLDIPFSTTALKRHIPLFYQKLGGGKKMRLDLSFKDVTILYGNYDTDLIAEYTMVMDWKPDDSGANKKAKKGEKGSVETIFYDELKMVTTMMLEVTDDIMYPNILNHKLDLNNKYAQTTSPVKNTMSVTENEYREYLQTLGFTLNEMKKWLNDVILLDGIKFPYSIDEVKTEVKFQSGSMHVFLEVEKEVGDFFEEEFWDEDYKKRRGKKDIDDQAKEVEFWDWKDMADQDYRAAQERVKRDQAAKRHCKGKKNCKPSSAKHDVHHNKNKKDMSSPAPSKEIKDFVKDAEKKNKAKNSKAARDYARKHPPKNTKKSGGKK